MDKINYLETLPLSGIAKYTGSRQPKDGVPFTGYPRQHPSDKNKLVFVNDPLGRPAVLEFRLEDVLFVEECHSAVTETGEGIPIIKLFIRKGAAGVILEPFEVNTPEQFDGKLRDLRARAGEQFAGRPGAGL
ncbi:MAG: hypothetical protein FWG66_02225 [Spirochaetes bacterium]|nr:hypothetical protein [Spirochaetota bacterium]